MLIATVRGQKVIPDGDRARVYGAWTKRPDEQARLNPQRFPHDFAFRLSEEEATPLLRSRSEFATSSESADTRPQIATASKRNVRFLPHAFTEHGAIMAANVPNSPQAVQISVFIVRAFVKMREQLISRVELEKRLLQVENIPLGHDDQIRDIYFEDSPAAPAAAGTAAQADRFPIAGIAQNTQTNGAGNECISGAKT